MYWIDSEVHLLPSKWCEPDYLPPSEEDILRRVVYDHPEGAIALQRATVSPCLEHMDSCGVDRAVIMGLPWRSSQRCWINNEYISDAQSDYPERFTGVGLLPPPENEDLIEAVRRIDDDMNLHGVKVIPAWHGYRLNDPELDSVWEEMAHRGLPLIPHIDQAFKPPDISDTPYALFDVARKHPNLRFIVPHLAGLLCLYELFPPVKPVLKNMAFITSVPMSIRMALFAIESVGADRVAFGTDYPFNPSHDIQSVKNELESLPLEPDQLKAVAGETAARFFGVS